ncbi:MAG: universal stress protein [Myxococcales bacterium]|nr:universal stress protein [Myxococcales bacterium]
MNPAPPATQVVIAYDFTPSAEEALQRAIEVACRAPHHVLHVLVSIDSHAGLSILPTKEVNYDYAQQIQEMVSQRMIARFAGREASSEIQFFVHARIGKPAEEILELAQSVSADLIFIGSHGKTGLERLVLGSVSERVVREAKCPVMVVRAKTYPPTELMHVIKYDHERPAYNAPHRYTYVDQRVVQSVWPAI